MSLELTKLTEEAASLCELVGKNEIGDNDFKLMPETIFEI